MTSISAAAEDMRDLVIRARDGDTSAFERLYRNEVGRIYALCLRMTNDSVRADTLTQDTFVRAWTNLCQFRDESTFSTWLYRIGVNVVLMSERSEKRRRGRVVTTGDRNELDVAVTPSREDAGLDLEEAIRRLPSQAKAVLILHEIDGYSHEEVGEMLEIAPGTSRAHLHRARSLLKQMLEA